MSRAVWQEYECPVYPPLEADAKTDVCVIGTGIGGATAAYLLSQSGLRVILLGDGALCRGETSRSTAQINTAHDDSWQEMEKLHGTARLRLVAESYRAALKFIARTVRSERIHCGFEYLPAYLFSCDYPRDPAKARQWLSEEFAAARRAHVTGISYLTSFSTRARDLGPTLLYEKQAQFDPVRYVAGLVERTASCPGASVRTLSRVRSVDVQDDGVVVQLSTGPSVHCAKVVAATNVPLHHRFLPYDALVAYRSYVIAIPIARHALTLAQYWDNDNPYHYVRLGGNSVRSTAGSSEDLLIVGGEDHRVGAESDAESAYNRLYSWTQEHFPVEGDIASRWSAQTIETFDGMPLLGSLAGDHENVYIITGDSGTGITHATLGGLIVSDLIQYGASPWAEIYDPSRDRTRALARWLRGNATNISKYGDWLTPGEVSSENEILPGSGAILRQGTSKIAVYHDPVEGFIRFSAHCPHLHGLVRWNPAEKSWDCPVHGSRFDCHGQVLNGPAQHGLQTLNGSAAGSHAHQPYLSSRHHE